MKTKKARKITAKIRSEKFEDAVQILEHVDANAYIEGFEEGQDLERRDRTTLTARPIVNRVASQGLRKPSRNGSWLIGSDEVAHLAEGINRCSVRKAATLGLEYTPRTYASFASFFSPEVTEENRKSWEAVERGIREAIKREKELDLGIFYGRPNPHLPAEVQHGPGPEAEWTPAIKGETHRRVLAEFDPTTHWTEHNATPNEPSVTEWLDKEKAQSYRANPSLRDPIARSRYAPLPPLHTNAPTEFSIRDTLGRTTHYDKYGNAIRRTKTEGI